MPGAPLGAVTRGTTSPNRLRRIDRWIVHRLGPALCGHRSPLVVDLGFGASPVTTEELAQRVRTVAPRARVLGIEIDPERVAAARDRACRGVQFRVGGFELPTPDSERPLLVRAANVLRQYDEADVAAAWATMSARLAPGGLLVEGTCDELGRVAAWVAIPHGRDQPETLTLSVALQHVERPGTAAQRLPKVLIHRNVPGEAVHRLLADADAAWSRSATYTAFGPRQRWLAMVGLLQQAGWPVVDGPRRWRLGELTVQWHAVAPANG